MPSIRENTQFLRFSILYGAGALILSLGSQVMASHRDSSINSLQMQQILPDEARVASATERLMNEHGLKRRILLMYDELLPRLNELSRESEHMTVIKDCVNVDKNLFDEHHEVLEEQYIYPLFENHAQLAPLVEQLREQNKVSKRINRDIMTLVDAQDVTPERRAEEMKTLLSQYSKMYRAHMAWEDSRLLPALSSMLNDEELHALANTFRQHHDAHLGESGLNGVDERISSLENRLGIKDLAYYTP